MPSTSGKMFGVKCFTFVLTIIVISMNEAAPVPTEDQEVVISFTEHKRATKQFKCGKPQSRSYRIADLLPEKNMSIIIYPVSTVVQRCDQGSGCCNASSVCRPNPDSITYKLYEVNVVDATTRESEIKILEVEEHGQCQCQRNPGNEPVPPPKIRLIHSK